MLSLTPSVLDFGCVAQGFNYGLEATIRNNDIRTQRIRVFCNRIMGPDQNHVTATTVNHPIAPGMTTVIKIELHAETSGTTSQYEIVVIAEHNNLELRATVNSIVVPMDIFKCYAKSLALQNKSGKKSLISEFSTFALELIIYLSRFYLAQEFVSLNPLLFI